MPFPPYNRDRLATHAEAEVTPGALGTFTFRVCAPDAAGTYRMHVRPVVEGVASRDGGRRSARH